MAPYVVVLGLAQDGGYPQAGCAGACCAPAWADPALRRHVACAAIVDPDSGERWLIDATPDLREQLKVLDDLAPPLAPDSPAPRLSGILLTHGHVGHYTGLIHLGREVMGATEVPVYVTPRLAGFLRGNEPWAALVRQGNIVLRDLVADSELHLNPRLRVTPLPVPHRDENTDTVAFRVRGPSRSVLYLPDIDAWDAWPIDLPDAIATVDVAYLDGTFFSSDELHGRDMSVVPHPPISSTLGGLADLPLAERVKVRFVHLNHTNPALHADSPQRQLILKAGCGVAEELETVAL